MLINNVYGKDNGVGWGGLVGQSSARNPGISSFRSHAFPPDSDFGKDQTEWHENVP